MKCLVTILLAAFLLYPVSAAIVYRGRLAVRSGAAVTTARDVSFNLYAAEKGGDPVWGMRTVVTPDTNGNIQVTLADGLSGVTYLVDEAILTNVLQRGKADYVGITIGDANEISPRQAILAQPRAIEARKALRLAPGGTTRTLSATTLSATTLQVASEVTVLERLATETPATLSLAVTTETVIRNEQGTVQPLWKDWIQCANAVTNSNFTAPYSGVYFITTLPAMPSAYALVNMVMFLEDADRLGWWAPGLVLFCKQDVTYTLPYLGPSGATIYCRPYSAQ